MSVEPNNAAEQGVEDLGVVLRRVEQLETRVFQNQEGTISIMQVCPEWQRMDDSEPPVIVVRPENAELLGAAIIAAGKKALASGLVEEDVDGPKV